MIEVEPNKTEQISQQGTTANVLIVDDDVDTGRLILEILAHKGIRGDLAEDKKHAIDLLNSNSYRLVFLSAQMSCGPGPAVQRECGFELFRIIKADSPELPVVMIGKAETSKAADRQRNIETAVQAIRIGCCDFLVKPLSRDKVQNLLNTFVPNHKLSTASSVEDPDMPGRSLYTIVGRSVKLTQTVNLAKRVAPTSAPVLISGESGTGKELISHLVHLNSKRAWGPYIRVNCAALSETLLESELFGHEKGAFTGAHIQRKGRFEMAHGGTLLLDEISETPLKFQAKLLRVLEQQDFERVGGNENVRINIRVISTTNKNLLQEIPEGRFRQDLYYRLSAVRLITSPLRQRLEDIPELVWHFVNVYAPETQRRIRKLDPAMMEIFKKYPWPGNIRQLRNVVLTSLILGVGETLSLADVSWLFDELQPLPQEDRSRCDTSLTRRISTNETPWENDAPIDSGLGRVPLVEIEQRAILETLRRTSGNQAKAAKVLGISDRTLRYKIRRYRQQGALELK